MKKDNMDNFKISIYEAESILGYDYVQKCKKQDGVLKGQKEVSSETIARWFKNSEMNFYYSPGRLFSSSTRYGYKTGEKISAYDAMFFFGYESLEQSIEKCYDFLSYEECHAYENYLKERGVKE